MSNITRQFVIGLASLAIATGAFAGVQKPSSSKPAAAQSAKSAAPSKSKSSTPTTLAASGKIVRFDPSAQSLTLATSKGEEQFTLDAATHLRDSSHSIAPNDLTSLTGHQATVRYQESSGQKTVVSVRVSGQEKKAKG
jgi:hypothetical protein